MGQVSLVTGQAGTGKTTWLVESVKKHAPQIISDEHRKTLAITRMHGARRRMDMKLREACPEIRCSVTTIDGFALSILNRWRSSLGYQRPIQAVNGKVDFMETLFGIEADFDRVIEAAICLLHSNTVRRIVGESYPLIIIDEFQDCHGSRLEFVKTLSICSTLLLAADAFQLLDTSTSGCPAVEWVKILKDKGNAEVTELTECHRTSNKDILGAARCLRDNIRSSGTTVPVVCCPKEGPIAWKIIEKLVFSNNAWTGTTALICPSHDPLIQKVICSCDNQLRKRNCDPIRWHMECDPEEEQQRICSSLGLSDTTNTHDCYWTVPAIQLDPIGANVKARSQRFAHLRGLSPIPHSLVARHVDTIVHERRAYCAYLPSRSVTTVHGAKNREFDNVFVLWTYKLTSDQNQQRRLLYNAITRAKLNCVVLVYGDVKRAQNDPILSLLGPPQPAFSRKTKLKKRSSKKARPSVPA
jgi:UvrD-like helicase C-terminal domain/AAA domain